MGHALFAKLISVKSAQIWTPMELMIMKVKGSFIQLFVTSVVGRDVSIVSILVFHVSSAGKNLLQFVMIASLLSNIHAINMAGCVVKNVNQSLVGIPSIVNTGHVKSMMKRSVASVIDDIC